MGKSKPEIKVFPDVNVHEEPIIPKEEQMEFDKIELPKFFDYVEKKKKSMKKNLTKLARPSSVPQIVKEPQDPDSILY